MRLPVWISTASVVFGVYFLTAFQSLPGGDSGELLAESCLHGTSHPPGYPTFMSLAGLVKDLPLTRVFLSKEYKLQYDPSPSFAWKVNILCAVFGTVCAAAIASTTYELLTNMNLHKFKDAVSIIAGASFAFSPLIWEYSTTAEVFALNNAILAVQLWFTIRILSNRNSRDPADHTFEFIFLCLGSFLSGLAMSNQHAAAIQLVVVIPFAFFATLRRFTFGRFVALVLSLALGLSPYYLLFLNAQVPKLGSWGDLSSVEGFLRHVLRAEYGTFQLGIRSGAETAVERIIAYAKFTSKEYYHAIFPLVAVCVLFYFDIRTFVGAGSKSTATSGSSRHVKVTNKKTETPVAAKVQSENAVASEDTTSGTGIRQRKKSEKSSGTPSSPSQPAAAEGKQGTSSSHAAPVTITPKANLDPDAFGRNETQLSLLCLLCTWIVYLVAWHGVLSNLPLSAPMPFAVHSRFWMQPNIPLVILAGVGLGAVVQRFCQLFSDPWANTLSDANSAPDRAGIIGTIFSAVLVAGAVGLIVRQRYPMQDRSKDGYAVHGYGNRTLSQLPKHSILLTHTDLDWNSVRYFQACHDHRTDVSAISLQLMPYPWFPKTQAGQYARNKITFPRADFPGVSTDRMSEGNARLITDFIAANKDINPNPNPPSPHQHPHLPAHAGLHNQPSHMMSLRENDLAFLKLDVAPSNENMFGPGIFLDMQAVNEMDLGDIGQWRGYTLLPWGNVYRVLNPLSMEQVADYHQVSIIMLRHFAAALPTLDDGFYGKYPAGSWEHAVASVHNDAHYQLGLFFLTYAIEALKGVDLVKMTVIIDRMHIACRLLSAAVDGANKYHALSVPLSNVRKNTALAYMKYQGVLNVAVTYKHDVEKHFYKSHLNQRRLIKSDLLDSVVTRPQLREISRKAVSAMREFIAAHPDDADVQTFNNSANHIDKELNANKY